MMAYARFGRMRVGRCATAQYGAIGCSVDVLHILHEICSGRQECTVDVIDPRLVRMKPCPDEVSSYLEATYECQQVIASSDEDCMTKKSIEVRDKDGTISSLHAATKCPHVIRAQPGQSIEIRISEISDQSALNETIIQSTAVCVPLAYITEPEIKRRQTICRQLGRHGHKAFSSSTHIVSVQVAQTEINYLLNYKVKGCPSLNVPKLAYLLALKEDTVTIKCNFTRQAFTLVCEHNEWTGTLRNCSSTGLNKPPYGEEKQASDMPSLGLSFLIVFGVAAIIVIYVAAMIVCVTFIKRRQRSKARQGIMAAEGKLTHHGEPLRYEQFAVSPQLEHMPMLERGGGGGGHMRLNECGDYGETICRVHGPFPMASNAGTNPVDSLGRLTSQECPYSKIPPCCKCFPANKPGGENQPSAVYTDEHGPGRDSTYEQASMVRFATINTRLMKNINLRSPHNSTTRNHVFTAATEQSVPDVLTPCQNEDNGLRENTIVSIKSI